MNWQYTASRSRQEERDQVEHHFRELPKEVSWYLINFHQSINFFKCYGICSDFYLAEHHLFSKSPSLPNINRDFQVTDGNIYFIYKVLVYLCKAVRHRGSLRVRNPCGGEGLPQLFWTEDSECFSCDELLILTIFYHLRQFCFPFYLLCIFSY